jgi:hypothetical protein
MKVAFPYKSPMSSALMNFAFTDIIPEGVYVAPQMAASLTTSSVTISPGWVIRSVDGMTVSEDTATITLTLPGVGLYWVGVDAEYSVANDPMINIQAIPISSYVTWNATQQAAFIIFAQVNVTPTAIQIDQTQATLPRGVFALQQDLIAKVNGVTVTSVSNSAGLSQSMSPNSVVYVQDSNKLSIFLNGTQWTQIGQNIVGGGVFNSTTGTNVALPASVPLAVKNDITKYMVFISQTANSGGHVGETWVLKGQRYDQPTNSIVADPNYFLVMCSGTVPTPGAVGQVTFDWLVTLV